MSRIDEIRERVKEILAYTETEPDIDPDDYSFLLNSCSILLKREDAREAYIDKLEAVAAAQADAIKEASRLMDYLKKLEAAAREIEDPCDGCEAPFCTLDQGGAPCPSAQNYNKLKQVMEGRDEIPQG